MTDVRGLRAGRLFGALVVALVVPALTACIGPTPSQAVTCDPPDRTPVVDEEHGFSMCLPGNWLDLRPGDPAWLEVYDEPNSATEQQVAAGSITRFVAPLRPRDADTAVHMTIYARANTSSMSTAQAGDAYLEQARTSDATDLEVNSISLPAGQFAEVTGTIPNTISDVPSTDWLDAFVIATPERVYYVLFRCTRTSKDRYEADFQLYASSFTLLEGRAETTSGPS